METGEIYVWDTTKAKGHETRRKFHVFICESDWQEDNTFLFINKANWGGDFAISNGDYPFLTLQESYIDCAAIVSYTDTELQEAKPQLVGQLSPRDAQNLFQAIAASDTMSGRDIRRVCEALKKLL